MRPISRASLGGHRRAAGQFDRAAQSQTSEANAIVYLISFSPFKLACPSLTMRWSCTAMPSGRPNRANGTRH